MQYLQKHVIFSKICNIYPLLAYFYILLLPIKKIDKNIQKKQANNHTYHAV